MGNTLEFRLPQIPVTISIRFHRKGDQVHWRPSHAIKTPLQLGPYRTSKPFHDTEDGAVRRAVVMELWHYYDAAVKSGHKPDMSWLVPY